ncbi:glycyl-tRNA synthetase beta chain [Stakelama sediminis]|uniref:Glycine--tRNA ligase beta subunit n=1 Tax=Stakelama sediminis TaxID=463200 RepID=A0A840YV64_9SPHN|nr:glycine--tRNA ligase subunit beta [Stakelama sediminis]MBB5717533.1 glycyl-tRNA synthetase beta chain [Stakelama sediminis]
MSDFLLELRSEEIPARMQERARADLEKLFSAELDKAGLKAGAVTTYATPRRLALIARGLPDATEAVSEELKGPPEGAPDAAIDGFCRKAGVARDQLEVRDVKGRATYFAVFDKPGRATADVLAEAVPAVVHAFPWPKSMRWGEASLSTESLRWVRPLQGIVALFGGDVVPCEVAGIASGATTVGHRFHHPQPITIGSADDYVEKLRMAHVIVDGAERRATIALGAKMAAQKAGLTLIEDEGLLYENAGLTEWPVPLLGRFDEAFLQVPPEVIQLTARVNQKYFVCQSSPERGGGPSEGRGRGASPNAASGGTPPPSGADAPATSPGRGGLANAFICVANIDAEDGGEKILAGNRKVLAARLSDAKFFYDTDLKTKLKDWRPKLEKIVFHEKLGTVADKVERVAKLARWLVESDIVTPAKAGVAGESAGQEPQAMPASAGMTKEALADLAESAARLCKADLVTGMVGEFPELQGLMGGYYALAQGEDPRVAEAIRDHYKPVGQGDDVPTAPVTVAVSLADKLDTIYNFFEVGEAPTGSKDPFALRRQALAVISLLVANNISTKLRSALFQSGQERFNQVMDQAVANRPELNKFLVEGLRGERVGDDWIARLKAALNTDVGPAQLTLADNGMTEVVSAFKMQDHWPKLARRLLAFFADRLKVQQREAGVRHDLIDAVFALGGEDDLVRLLARVKALQAFMETPDGANLLAGYKRAANILKKENVIPAEAGIVGDEGEPESRAMPASAGMTGAALSYTPEPAEAGLIAALDAAEPRAQAAVAAEDFEGAMAALATLRAPIDAFFESVTVNDSDADKRSSRLALLARMRAAVHNVADFSRIEG